MGEWEDAQEAELAWWGACTNTFDEEDMQFVEAQCMGLQLDGCTVRVDGGYIVDIGGGPTSLLLKAQGWDRARVVDPAKYPEWVYGRYTAAGIECVTWKGEKYVDLALGDAHLPDEVWMYNVLQHVEDPRKVVQGACNLAPVVRLFEWVEFPTNEAHIHTLHAADIVRWATEAGSLVDGAVEPIEWRGERNLGYHAVMAR